MSHPAAPRHRTNLATALVVSAVLAASGYAGAVMQDGPAAAAGSHHRTAQASPAQPRLAPSASPTVAAPPATHAPGTAVPVAADRSTVPVSTLAADGIPTTALSAYQRAAREADARYPSCHIVWPLVAAIGRVESDHGRYGGAVLHTDGVSTPGIVGVPLDGNGTEVVRDTDHGALDGDPVYDRAVGPMQFIPSTWLRWGVDADHDGRVDINDIFDAAAATADYLCASGGDLATYAGQERAVLTYNHSVEYLHTVLGLEQVYAHGVVTVPTAPGHGRPTLPTTTASPEPAVVAAAPPVTGPAAPTAPAAPPSTTASAAAPATTTPATRTPGPTCTPKPKPSASPSPSPTRSAPRTPTPTRSASPTRPPGPTRTPHPTTSRTPTTSPAPTPTCR